MPIVWDKSYLVGDETIDSQHQELFHLANMMLNANDPNTLKVCFLDLHKYVRDHFSHEEALMRYIEYSDYEVHLAGHHALSSGLNAASDELGKGTLDKERVQRLIANWAYGHIPIMDNKLAKYIKAHKELS